MENHSRRVSNAVPLPRIVYVDAQAPPNSADGPSRPPELHAASANTLSFRELLTSSPKLHKYPTPPYTGLDNQYETGTAWTRLAQPLVGQQEEKTPGRQRQLLPIPIPEGCHYPPPREDYTMLSAEHSLISQPGAPYFLSDRRHRDRRGQYKSGHFVCPFARPRRENPGALLCSKVFKTRRSVIHPLWLG
jgi:hypothetical protein